MNNLKFSCPVCQLALKQIDKTLKCENNHSFDLAKKGYANLLLSHQMRSKQPGDNKEMILARSQFLDQNYYLPLIERISEILKEYKINDLLDAGCGEGYYTEFLKKDINNIDGIDISKEGILHCSKRDKSINWCIGSVTSLPYLEDSFDAVLSVFCRVDDNEFAKVLKSGGIVLFIGPGDDHLPNLRSQIYKQVLPYQTDKQQEYFTENFDLIHQEQLRFNFELAGADILPLLTMTPHYWKCTQEQKAKLNTLVSLNEQADFSIKVFKKH